MTRLARARGLVAASGVVVAALAAVALWHVGGPATSRQETRDARRHADLIAISHALECHNDAAAAPGRPASLAEFSPACLAADRARELVDPRTGAAYALDYPEAGIARLCAEFEGVVVTRRWTPENFDAATGCISLALPDRARPGALNGR